MHGWRARAAIAMLALAAAAMPVAAKPLVIRQGWVVMPANATPLIFEKPDILKHYGKSYTVDPIHFAGTSPQLVALETGQIDFATLAYSSFANGIENGHLDDLRIVADGFQDGVKGYASIQYLVRNNSPIKRVEDLKGKVVGINVIGAAVDIGARAVLAKHGLVAGRDYTIIEAPFSTIGSILLQGKADVVSDVAPFLYRPDVQKNAHTLFTMKDGMGTSQMIVIVSRTEFLSQHRHELDDFFEDLVRGTHWLLNPANRQAAIALAARVAKMPPSLLEPYYLTRRDSYRDPNAIPNLAAFQRNIDTQVKFGFLKHSFDVKKYADLSFVERAARRVNAPSH